MIIEPLGVEGAYLITPTALKEEGSESYEWYRPDLLQSVTGVDWRVAGATTTRCREGALRGIHFEAGQQAPDVYLTCVQGRVAGVVVDVRIGSPTFGRWVPLELDANNRSAAFIGGGLGHGFQALTDGATVVQLSSARTNPQTQISIHPLCSTLSILWPIQEAILLDRDRLAPDLEQAREFGLLPVYSGQRMPGFGLR